MKTRRRGSRLAFRHGGALVDPLTQQLAFDFDTTGTRQLSVVRAGGHDPARQAAEVQEMFLRAVKLEENPDTTFFVEEKVVPTREGLASAELQIAPSPDSSRLRWSTLPVLSTWNRVTEVKPGATTLLTGSGAGVPAGQVVMASQRYGRGRVLAFPVQDSWVWQMSAEIAPTATVAMPISLRSLSENGV